jgi:hypothetical protein
LTADITEKEKKVFESDCNPETENDMNMQAFDQHRSEKVFLKAVYNFSNIPEYKERGLHNQCSKHLF